ncbi:outer membrane protein assembly factor BamE [Bartonella sp. B10834H15]|nr:MULTISPECIES: outer membrane protein assembly factor BamE [Bartonella]MBH9975326.1 outer membrane protein assembly factor BamE [Bartonella choladocola]MBI0014933.1 outer membrane protein assembly factor BamE [Bartonella sp. B10834G3]MBI0140508.1 outer membrane protein assembly factor BamE [Bartonella choladocola]
MSLFHTIRIKTQAKHGLLIGLIAATAITLSGCKSHDFLKTSQTYNEGYVLDESALASVPVGSSRDQVLLALGSPSMTAMYDNEVFYYISQTRYRGAQFMKPKIVDRKILAIYFNKNGQVERIANYGLQDGKVIDTITQTTPTGGHDQSFLSQLIKGSKGVPQLPQTGR